MKGVFDIFRKNADDDETYREKFEVEFDPGDTLLDVFHIIQHDHDPSFAYRYSCRGAICGSCAVRVNGVAALACKTQVATLVEQGEVVVDPIGNLMPITDLVVDLDPFFDAYKRILPFIRRDIEDHDYVHTEGLDPKHFDQMIRAITCIKCAACFSDCPKRADAETFMGPAAAVALYKYFFDSRDAARDERIGLAADPDFGVVACDSHANCVKVCPKDVRPLRAINFIRKELSAQE
ncbi:MAG: 2Fe-2S iron-sulfur cluster-binding protein [Candidatus Lernaella stagnicola]|nr:2Fe-2S iron-sulfur cluster-binding protein [Candidatus Lernaella stagnicola]